MCRIIQPGEFPVDQPISALIYGQPGVGKTTLALSAPNPILLDADLGMQRVEERFHCPTARVINHEQVMEILASQEIREFRTIVFDTIGKIVNNIVDYVGLTNPRVRQPDGSISIKGWGGVKIRFQELMRVVRALDKDIIFLAHEKEEKINNTRLVRPDIAGSSGKDIIHDMDMMGYMYIRNQRRAISFSPDDTYYAKNSLGLESIIEVPTTENGNTFFTDKIVREVTKKRTRGQELARKYNELRSSQINRIEEVQTLDELNEIYGELGKEEKIWDSESCWKRILNEKCQLLGAAFNRDTKVFEPLSKVAA